MNVCHVGEVNREHDAYAEADVTEERDEPDLLPLAVLHVLIPHRYEPRRVPDLATGLPQGFRFLFSRLKPVLLEEVKHLRQQLVSCVRQEKQESRPLGVPELQIDEGGHRHRSKHRMQVTRLVHAKIPVKKARKAENEDRNLQVDAAAALLHIRFFRPFEY